MFSNNLKYLRSINQISQGQLSDDVLIPRTTLGDYERGKTEPSIANLLKVAKYFQVSVDDLLKIKLNDQALATHSTKGLKVLTISVDSQNNQNIELVDTKAEAGYIESFSDPEYIRDLPKMYIPGLKEKTYRGFTIRGDSMLPLESGTIIICSYVERLKDIKSGSCYIIVSKREGLVYKRVYNQSKLKTLKLVSDNSAYLPYEIAYEEIDEIWAYQAHVGFADTKTLMDDMIEEKLSDIQMKVTEIHSKLS